MKWSRRELPLLWPALAAAQRTGANLLQSAAFRFEDMAPRKSGSMIARQILRGTTHTGFRIDVHESDLPPGEAPHAPHRHIHEEVLFLRDGVLDVSIDGRVTRLGPGSAAYFASNQEHGWHNVGQVAAAYFVLALGEDTA